MILAGKLPRSLSPTSTTRHVPMTSGKRCFISTMGIEGLQIYNACDPADTDTIAIIIGKMDGHILGQTHDTFERYKFNTRAQHSDETTDTYVAALKNLRKTCNFCDCLQDSLCNGIACFNTLIIYQHKQLVTFRMFNTTELSIYTCLLTTVLTLP